MACTGSGDRASQPARRGANASTCASVSKWRSICSRAVLLDARGDEQVIDRDAVVTEGRELALRGEGDGDGLGVHPQIAEEREVVLEALVVAM